MQVELGPGWLGKELRIAELQGGILDILWCMHEPSELEELLTAAQNIVEKRSAD